MEALDDLARTLFPGLFVELKWAEGQFLPALEPIADKHGVGHRSLEIARAKMRRLGVIAHVSRFNKRWGYREGWVFSSRFARSLERLAKLFEEFKMRGSANQERRDRDLHLYL